MGAIYTKTRELTAGDAGTPLSESHLPSHDNIDAEIQDISTALSAIDFTPWASWLPTFDIVGAGTLSNRSISIARWMRIGNTVWFDVNATNEVSGADGTDTAITFTFPVNTTAKGHLFTALTRDPTKTSILIPGYAFHTHDTDANKVWVQQVFSSTTAVNIPIAWTTGTLRQIWVQGFYEVK